jgi:TatD DNase family protein
MIDTHCHLDFDDFQPDRSVAREGNPSGVPGVLARAKAAGVDGCITICTTTHGAARLASIASSHERVWFSAGVHPLYSDEGPHEWNYLKVAALHPKCVAFGELGLDNHYKEPARTLQQSVLAEQLAHLEAWRKEGIAKPVVIHCRDAFDDLLPILGKSTLPRDGYVFHCFTGTPEEARRVLDFGAMISFTGVATYKTGQGVRDAAALVPADRIMIETDAPFLSPEPHRSTRPCEPWMASLTAKAIAAVRGEEWETFHHQINANTARFFGVQ